MTQLVAHRGPDGFGTALLEFTSNGVREAAGPDNHNWCVALGHRRLSILDLSDAGRQPMCWYNRLWITFNGEIYNYLELRYDLQKCGHQFQTATDTEVILAAYDEWGTDCFAKMRGMWGLAIVDGPRHKIVLSRDRLGIKPIYMACSEQGIAIVSEIKQLTLMPGFRLKPHAPVLCDYLSTGYERENVTFFEDVKAIPPGTWQLIDLPSGSTTSPQPYWHPERIRPEIFDIGEASRLFREALEDSVKVHLRSDVPVGCALSGGLDSSAIAGCISTLQRKEDRHLETFTVTFPGSKIDEEEYARTVIGSTRSLPHFVTPTPERFLADLDRFTWIHDEPVGGLPQFAAYSLARLTREVGVPVTLNGQGGDEILAGYWQSYFMHLRGLFCAGHWLSVAGHFLSSMLPGGNPQLLKQVPASSFAPCLRASLAI